MTNLKRSRKHILRIIAEMPPARRQRLSLTRLIIRSELSQSTVRRSLLELQQAGLITVIRPYIGVPYSFEVAPHALQELERA